MSDSSPSLSYVSEREVSVGSERARSADLHRLFHPASIAIIGASRDEKKSGGDFMKRTVERGYSGKVYPINLRETEVFGHRAYASVLAVPESIDLAVFCIPAPLVAQVMSECVAKGVKFAIVHTSGFTEVGDSGLEARIVKIARDGGLRFVGPNCMGVFCNDSRLSFMDASPDPQVVGADVGFIAQSGTLCDNFMIQGQERGLKINKSISLGNEADLKFTDYLDYMAADPQVKVIGAYIEGIREGRRFLDVVERVNRRKPVVVWKAGRTSAGARATLSHTGSIAGSDRINDAAFRQIGVLRAVSMEALIDFTAGFYTPFLPQGPRVGILVDTGGGAVSAADAFEAAGLEVARLSEKVQRGLREGLQGQIPPFAGITNPVDLVSPKDADRIRLYQYCLRLMAPEVDSFVLITFHDLSDPNFLSAVERARDDLGKPFFMVPAMPQRELKAIKEYTRRAVPAFHNVERAARTIRGLADYARWRAA